MLDIFGADTSRRTELVLVCIERSLDELHDSVRRKVDDPAQAYREMGEQITGLYFEVCRARRALELPADDRPRFEWGVTRAGYEEELAELAELEANGK